MQIVSLFLITRHFMAFQISKICKCTWYFLSPPSIPTIQPYISCHEAPETAVKVKGWLDWGLEGIPWRCGRSAAVEPNSFCRWTESLKIPCSNPPPSDLIRFASSILAPRPPVSLCLVQRASHAIVESTGVGIEFLRSLPSVWSLNNLDPFYSLD